MKNKTNINNSSIESAGIPKDYKQAIAELIWNGFENPEPQAAFHHKVLTDQKDAQQMSIGVLRCSSVKRITRDALRSLSRDILHALRTESKQGYVLVAIEPLSS